MARRPPAATTGNSLRLGAAIRTREFGLMYACGLLTSFALFIAFVHVVPFAQSHGAAALPAAALVGVIGAGSVAGRLALGGAAERLGSVRAFQAAVAIVSFSFAVWLLAPGFWALVVFALLLGVGYGGWVALSPTVSADLFGAEGLGGTVGALYTSAGVGALLGPSLAGFVVDRTGSYQPAIILGLVLAVGAAGLVAYLPVRRRVHSREVQLD
jgi:MFS family permease